MQKYSVSLTVDAENDIAELMAFYDELVDTESATNFLDEAMETVASLQSCHNLRQYVRMTQVCVRLR